MKLIPFGERQTPQAILDDMVEYASVINFIYNGGLAVDKHSYLPRGRINGMYGRGCNSNGRRDQQIKSQRANRLRVANRGKRFK